MPRTDAEEVAEFLAERLERLHGRRWLGGVRRPALACECASPPIQRLAARRLFQVKDAVPRALVAWAAGERKVHLLHSRPTPRAVLAWQARGWRCVSLLSDDARTAPHATTLDFAIHDLCHLEKFAAPDHHLAQVGFFSLLNRSMDDPRWRYLDESLDAEWAGDRDHVLADMNGHAVYLFVALKRKLLLAVKRAASESEDAMRDRAPPDATRALATLVDLFELEGSAREAACRIGSRGALPPNLDSLNHHFERNGISVTS